MMTSGGLQDDKNVVNLYHTDENYKALHFCFDLLTKNIFAAKTSSLKCQGLKMSFSNNKEKYAI